MDDARVVHCLEQIRAGNHRGLEPIWQYFQPPMLRAARGWLRLRRLPGAGDEEDVVQTALWSFYLRARRGSYVAVTGRAELWRLLHAAVIRRALDLVRAAGRQKRGGCAAVKGGPLPDVAVVADPGAELEGTEELLKILDRLALAGGDAWRIALCKFAGRSNDEIIAALGCSLATFKRRLAEIRTCLRGGVKCRADGAVPFISRRHP
jgi:DNA-directed RNA polymerase specialized sigma24 family protein